ncbi:MAG: hypothetical protein SCARUB_03904 [Candidatus Scalindua rubra]|uniref:Uncharacterized protein n=1 Tax=Candidatus Scalindua rubra TaxID=1872076 RepID=A0A1E3X5W0_9BACT|nr:MAG: hypothetical protein SCARUB_03904 [Candidatus Scalindua rubra]
MILTLFLIYFVKKSDIFNTKIDSRSWSGMTTCDALSQSSSKLSTGIILIRGKGQRPPNPPFSPFRKGGKRGINS